MSNGQCIPHHHQEQDLSLQRNLNMHYFWDSETLEKEIAWANDPVLFTALPDLSSCPVREEIDEEVQLG